MEAHEGDSKLHLDMAIEATTVLTHIVVAFQDHKPIPLTFEVDTESECVETPGFYTSLTQGYKLSIKVYPKGHGDGCGTHVSANICLHAGDYDDELSWPMKANVTITLLNQLEDENHFSKTTPVNAKANEEIVSPTFIPLSELGLKPDKNTQYCKDNTLYFSVSVKLTNNWLKCVM